MVASRHWWWHVSGRARSDPEPDEVTNLSAERFRDMIAFEWDLPRYHGRDAEISKVQHRYKHASGSYVTADVGATATMFTLSPATLAALTLAEVEEEFEFGVRVQNDEGHWSDWKTVTASLLALPALQVVNFSPVAGGRHATMVLSPYSADLSLETIGIQMRLDTADDWNAGSLVAVTEERLASSPVDIPPSSQGARLLVGGLSPATEYDVRTRFELMHGGSVWRSGAWFNATTPATAADVSLDTLTNPRARGRKVRISGTYTGAVRNTADDWQAEVSVDNKVTWTAAGVSRIQRSGGNLTIDIGDVPTAGGAVWVRLRYVLQDLSNLDLGKVYTPWVVAPSAVTFADDRLTAYSLSYASSNRRLTLQVRWVDATMVSTDLDDWALQYRVGSGGTWTDMDFGTATVSPFGTGLGMWIQSLPVPGDVGGSDPVSFRIRLPGTFDTWEVFSTTATIALAAYIDSTATASVEIKAYADLISRIRVSRSVGGAAGNGRNVSLSGSALNNRGQVFAQAAGADDANLQINLRYGSGQAAGTLTWTLGAIVAAVNGVAGWEASLLGRYQSSDTIQISDVGAIVNVTTAGGEDSNAAILTGSYEEFTATADADDWDVEYKIGAGGTWTALGAASVTVDTNSLTFELTTNDIYGRTLTGTAFFRARFADGTTTTTWEEWSAGRTIGPRPPLLALSGFTSAVGGTQGTVLVASDSSIWSSQTAEYEAQWRNVTDNTDWADATVASAADGGRSIRLTGMTLAFNDEFEIRIRARFTASSVTYVGPWATATFTSAHS